MYIQTHKGKNKSTGMRRVRARSLLFTSIKSFSRVILGDMRIFETENVEHNLLHLNVNHKQNINSCIEKRFLLYI